jgi:hypothetical protein
MGRAMTPDEQVQKTATRINARIAEEPAANGDYFALTPAGREAVRQILNQPQQPQSKEKQL